MANLPVSVFVPVFNGEAFLRESLDSILGQTYAPREVIVMDDASTDSTAEIVASYGNAVRYVRQPANRGQFGNVNDGLALATGELIGVFHADDVYLPQMLEREVGWLTAHPEAGAVFCADVFIDAEGREFGRLQLPEEVSGARVLDYAAVVNALLTHTNTFLRCPTALIRARVYREVGGYRDARFKNTSDVDMWLRIARRYPIGIVDEHLVQYRRGHGSSSERYHRVRTDPFRYFEIVDEHLRSGGADVATPEALQAHEAHRAVDAVMRAVNHYILGDVAAAQAVRAEVRLRALATSSRIDRGRMLVLAAALALLVRLPHVRVIGRAFARHWYGSPNPAGTA